ncbi:hypothetical protein VNO77_43000 [Canavalia gladiata]|uniref:Uncharacterized protein n=1 Tax=Canavalia gladiata TaxID=3824 RepID=A0AAN9JTA3_CANGL
MTKGYFKSQFGFHLKSEDFSLTHSHHIFHLRHTHYPIPNASSVIRGEALRSLGRICEIWSRFGIFGVLVEWSV